MPTPKLVVIAIDSADSSLVREWASQGHLPTLAGLLESGVVIPIATPIAVLEGGIWPTLLTSSSPATHGMYSFQAVKAGSYDVEIGMSADRLPTPPFWSHMSRGREASRRDRRAIRPTHRRAQWGPGPTNWGAHDAWCWPRSSSPSDLIEAVVKRFGEHPVPYCDAPNRWLADYEGLAGRAPGVERKTTLLRYFLARRTRIVLRRLRGIALRRSSVLALHRSKPSPVRCLRASPIAVAPPSATSTAPSTPVWPLS